VSNGANIGVLAIALLLLALCNRRAASAECNVPGPLEPLRELVLKEVQLRNVGTSAAQPQPQPPELARPFSLWPSDTGCGEISRRQGFGPRRRAGDTHTSAFLRFSAA